MKLKLIENEGVSNEFDIYLEPNRILLGRFQINPTDELDFEVGEDEGLSAYAIDSAYFYFESGSV